MKKVEKLESLKQELEDLKVRKDLIFQKKHVEMNTFFEEYFVGLPFTNVGGYDQDTFYFSVPNGDYDKEICKLEINRNSWNENKKETELRISYYSTTECSEFEINRLITIGKIAELVKDDKDGILYSHKQVSKKYDKHMSKLQSEIWAKDREINDINNELAQEANEKHRSKAFSSVGIDFSKPRRFDLKNGDQAWNVINLRILGWVNENQKSVDIQTISEAQVWDQKQEKYVMSEPMVQNHTKIRYSNIKWIIENF